MGRGAENMPTLLHARAPQDTLEEQKVRKLANSRHAPADWIMRARMIVRSWDGLRTRAIAEELGCHPQTVRERFHRFNEEGLDGLGDRPGAGRKRRITEIERSLIISLVATDPPGRLVRGAGGELEARDEQREAHWTLDALTTAARERGIAVGRSQVRRILLVEGVRWRNPHPWGESPDPEFVPKGQESSPSTPRSLRTQRPSAWMN
jgi:transposase